MSDNQLYIVSVRFMSASIDAVHSIMNRAQPLEYPVLYHFLYPQFGSLKDFPHAAG